MAHGDGHHYYEDLAVAHVLGGLDESDSRLFRAHLLSCADCRARVGELRNLAHELADVERDERRTRAAKTLETKERDLEDADAPADGVRTGRRLSRLVAVLAVAAILGLSLWNFTLRGSVARLQDNMERQAEAAALLEFGVPGEVVSEQPGVEGEVKVDGARMALLVDGLDDDVVYGVYIQDAAGTVLFGVPDRPGDGRLLALIRLPDGAHTLRVTAPAGQVTGGPSGSTVFQVRLPAEG